MQVLTNPRNPHYSTLISSLFQRGTGSVDTHIDFTFDINSSYSQHSKLNSQTIGSLFSSNATSSFSQWSTALFSKMIEYSHSIDFAVNIVPFFTPPISFALTLSHIRKVCANIIEGLT